MDTSVLLDQIDLGQIEDVALNPNVTASQEKRLNEALIHLIDVVRTIQREQGANA